MTQNKITLSHSERFHCCGPSTIYSLCTKVYLINETMYMYKHKTLEKMENIESKMIFKITYFKIKNENKRKLLLVYTQCIIKLTWTKRRQRSKGEHTINEKTILQYLITLALSI